MLAVLFEAIILASSGLLSVGSITLSILLFISDRGLVKGLSYALGYTGGYTIIGFSIILFQFQSKDASGGNTSILAYILQAILGVLLLYLSLKNYRKPRSEEPKENRFFKFVDNISPIKAFAFGMAVTVINFKNLALFLSALSVILIGEIALAYKLLFTLVIVLVFCSSVIVPLLIFILFPTRGIAVLTSIKDSLNTHSRPISIWIPFLFGLIFITRGVLGLI